MRGTSVSKWNPGRVSIGLGQRRPSAPDVLVLAELQHIGPGPLQLSRAQRAHSCENHGSLFMVLFRLLSLAGWERAKRQAAAVVGAAVFLVHPIATESVSYIAGRSESLAALFMLLTYVVFLGRYPEAISW